MDEIKAWPVPWIVAKHATNFRGRVITLAEFIKL
jgi:hypothetical protein